MTNVRTGTNTITPQRKIHLYHCDQRGLPLALVTPDNTVAWRGEYDEWGNLSGEENPEHLEQLIRLPGQQYDEGSGLYYNRYRYYNPGQGRYITQDPIGLAGGWNLYQYPLNPIHKADPLGLNDIDFGEEPFDAEDDMRDTALGKMDDNIFSIFPSSKVGTDIDIYEIAPYGISCFGNIGVHVVFELTISYQMRRGCCHLKKESSGLVVNR
ncbi:RHS repeat protein [Salmonella enterica subsp. enterica]|nr:RHS repeat protein [Salmonella enterica]ECI6492914.1 RHS repeat protein [Salmonella enterica subsp. enterica]EDP9633551.1 RHS repeat protein [Salmonella enterica subsp. enterica]EDT2837290.1 RHS repeat protein [Salmonella enterica subsp. enterica]EGG4121049.1 type IV secretion protein Rhs [Salmonella enterica]